MSEERKNDNYFFKPAVGLPKSAKLEILGVIERSGHNGIDESMYPEIRSILNKYGYILEVEPNLLIKRNPELPIAS